MFPLYNIRFIALSDNIDTENKDTAAMDMMPITNVFNEWWSAATSKKLRAVRLQSAKNGKNSMSHSPYGYVLGTDEKRTLQVNEETAPIVVRIFERRTYPYTQRLQNSDNGRNHSEKLHAFMVHFRTSHTLG